MRKIPDPHRLRANTHVYGIAKALDKRIQVAHSELFGYIYPKSRMKCFILLSSYYLLDSAPPLAKSSHFIFLAATRLSLMVWNHLAHLLHRYAPAKFFRSDK
jgi:hypothetical protein